ncbi:hypothetical protein [Granulicella mallensis]|uniref:Uncharacterized protein n=1 Tax=Granulicella mallensis TaxID=940614 RepID=A0A7W7ZS30_9BACT|nr:hypothetical protein [Granulicella mallensis]MBB5065063.1 hypothetical protein [Granulicella mallensis]
MGVRLGPNGQLLECNLSSNRVFPTLTIPAGSHLELTTNNEKDVPLVEAKVMLSEDIEWKAYGALLPAGAYLTLFADGQPDEIDAGSKSIQVRSLSLGSTMHWKYAGTPLGHPPGAHATVEYVKGLLLQELVCGTVKVKADQWIGIPAAGDRLMVWSENHNYGSPPLPQVECPSLHL